MRRRHQHFNHREHLLMGAELRDLQNRILTLWFTVEDAYGSAAGQSFKRAHDQIMRLKSGFEDRLCSEIPRSVNEIEGVPVLRVYYGWVAGSHPPRGLGTNTVLERTAFQARAENVFNEFGNPWTTSEPPAE